MLGENHKICGHDTIESFGEAMNSGAGAHLDAFVKFVQANKLDDALREHNWARFARGYNRPSYASNQYDTKMAAAYRKWSKT